MAAKSVGVGLESLSSAEFKRIVLAEIDRRGQEVVDFLGKEAIEDWWQSLSDFDLREFFFDECARRETAGQLWFDDNLPQSESSSLANLWMLIKIAGFNL